MSQPPANPPDSAAATPPSTPEERAARLRELAQLFLKLGATAFGGPAAHIAMMEEEVVRRRGWLSHTEFLDLLSATNLIPGPNSTEMAIHIGHRRAGAAGLLVAGACFIVPASLIVLGLAWVYVRYGSVPQLTGVFRAVSPVILAVIVQALWRLGGTAVRGLPSAALAFAALAAAWYGVHELLILAASAILAPLFLRRRSTAVAAPLVAPWAPVWPGPGPDAAGMVAGVSAASAGATLSAGSLVYPLFVFFLKVGSVLYGSGYVLVAFLQAELVDRRGWLTQQQLLDAVAVGQFTPGPVFTTATFVGYLLAGLPGALFCTVGIFLPAFVFVAAVGPFVPRLRRSALMAAMLDGVNVASLALMGNVVILLGRSSLGDAFGFVLFAIACVMLMRYRVNSAWLVLAAALLGALTPP